MVFFFQHDPMILGRPKFAQSSHVHGPAILGGNAKNVASFPMDESHNAQIRSQPLIALMRHKP